MISENQEIQMGREYNAQILKQSPRYQDQNLQEYVQSIGESLASKSHRPNLIYRFTVIDSPDINAFALPGGYIFINRGLMAYLSSEEELAAVLGHEIGHVTARHSVRQYSQSQLMGILSTAVEINAGRTAGNIANLASGALLSGYGRDMELEADDLGAQYIFKKAILLKECLKFCQCSKIKKFIQKRSLKKGDKYLEVIMASLPATHQMI